MRPALRMVQLGALAVVLVSVPLLSFELDRFFVPKELALHLTALLAGALTLRAAGRLPATRLDLWLLAALLLGAVSTAFATNPWAGGRSLAVAGAGVALFWVARALREAGLARPLLLTLATAVVLAALAALAQAYGLETDLFAENRAPGGTLGNRNFVAHLAAVGLPLLILAALRAYRAAGVLAAALGVTATTMVLVLSRSRAAWLAVAAMLLVLLVGWLLTPHLRRHRRSWLRFAALLPFLGAGVAAAILLPNSLRWRSESPYLETARGVVNYQEGSGRGRLVQYRNTLEMARDHPLLGVGPGNWTVEYPDYARPGDPSLDSNAAGMTANPWPSSDWVALVAERGPPASLLAALAWVGLALGGWRRMRAARDPDEGATALTLLAMIAAIAVAGLFDAVLLLAWPTLVFWAAAGALLDPVVLRPVDASPARRRAALLAVLLLCAVGAARSGGQLAAMAIYETRDDGASLRLAARLDPGSYRVHLRLARYYGRRSPLHCEHAEAAHALFPHAAAARRLAGRCGGAG